mmetsp:Transcript_15685/g.37242  ORF Transcript_15685/g.37242 Transcript_15685/m.37242 type:complete len:310 (+) Transcript_15685:1429-2358(+)
MRRLLTRTIESQLDPSASVNSSRSFLCSLPISCICTWSKRRSAGPSNSKASICSIHVSSSSPSSGWACKAFTSSWIRVVKSSLGLFAGAAFPSTSAIFSTSVGINAKASSENWDAAVNRSSPECDALVWSKACIIRAPHAASKRWTRCLARAKGPRMLLKHVARSFHPTSGLGMFSSRRRLQISSLSMRKATASSAQACTSISTSSVAGCLLLFVAAMAVFRRVLLSPATFRPEMPESPLSMEMRVFKAISLLLSFCRIWSRAARPSASCARQRPASSPGSSLSCASDTFFLNHATSCKGFKKLSSFCT